MRVGRTVVAVVLCAAMAQQAGAALLVVDQKLDFGDLAPGDGKCEWSTIVPVGQRCTLRAAVQEANALVGYDAIIIPDGWHIVLTLAGRDEDNAATGDLDILEDVGIGGFSPPGPMDWPIVDGGGIDRVFHVRASARLTIAQLQITGGAAMAPGPTHGGGILDATGGNGLELANCRIHRNVAEDFGGGIAAVLGVGGGAPSSIDSCTIEENKAGLGGTGIWNGGGTLLITRSTLSGNRPLTPGTTPAAIDNRAGLSLRNSTLSGNANAAVRSIDGNAIVSHSLVLRNVTIVGNGIGLDFIDVDSFGSPSITNSIVARNSIHDCSINGGAIDVTDNHNLDSDGSCGLNGFGSDLPNTDPLLDPLLLNGGTTRTMVPKVGSPVIDVGDNVICEANDQRGAPRPLQGDTAAICDIGAVEVLPCTGSPGGRASDSTIASPVTLEVCYWVVLGPSFDVLAGGDLSVRARDSISLDNGFSLYSGGQFTAIRDPAAGSGMTLP